MNLDRKVSVAPMMDWTDPVDITHGDDGDEQGPGDGAENCSGLPGLKAGSAVTFERLTTGEVVLRPAKSSKKPRASVFAKLRGRATVRMKTEDIIALTRGA